MTNMKAILNKTAKGTALYRYLSKIPPEEIVDWSVGEDGFIRWVLPKGGVKLFKNDSLNLICSREKERSGALYYLGGTA